MVQVAGCSYWYLHINIKKVKSRNIYIYIHDIRELQGCSKKNCLKIKFICNQQLAIVLTRVFLKHTIHPNSKHDFPSLKLIIYSKFEFSWIPMFGISAVTEEHLSLHVNVLVEGNRKKSL